MKIVLAFMGYERSQKYKYDRYIYIYIYIYIFECNMKRPF